MADKVLFWLNTILAIANTGFALLFFFTGGKWVFNATVAVACAVVAQLLLANGALEEE